MCKKANRNVVEDGAPYQSVTLRVTNFFKKQYASPIPHLKIVKNKRERIIS